MAKDASCHGDSGSDVLFVIVSAQTPAEAGNPKDGKDYAPLRIRGRQTFKLPGIGIIHADTIDQIPGGEMLMSGRVFLECQSAKQGGFAFGYAPKACWNDAAGTISLEGAWVIESSTVVIENRDPEGKARLDQKGNFTGFGRHRTQMR